MVITPNCALRVEKGSVGTKIRAAPPHMGFMPRARRQRQLTPENSRLVGLQPSIEISPIGTVCDPICSGERGERFATVLRCCAANVLRPTTSRELSKGTVAIRRRRSLQGWPRCAWRCVATMNRCCAAILSTERLAVPRCKTPRSDTSNAARFDAASKGL